MNRKEQEKELLKNYQCLEIDPLETAGVLLSNEIKYYVKEYKLIEPFNIDNLKPAAYKLTIGDEYAKGGNIKKLYDEPGKNEIRIPPYELKLRKILEGYERNPFLSDFYEGSNVNLETEITFLLIHYSQLKEALKNHVSDFILADFSIEKDLVYAILNLNTDELKVFENIYDYVIHEVGVPYVVIYIDLSLGILRRRIFQRGRPYELNADIRYFKQYNDKVKLYFKKKAQSKVHFFDVSDLELDHDNRKLMQIRDKILEVVGKST
ncbi:MAG: deoxynucleoside kinase [Halobacteriota archaeon]